MPEVNLKAERLNRGLSAQGVADKIGVQKNVLLNAESGASVPRPATALKIADFYGYRVTDIWPVDKAAA